MISDRIGGPIVAALAVAAVSAGGYGSEMPLDMVPVQCEAIYDEGSLIPAERISVRFNPIDVAKQGKKSPPGGDGIFGCSRIKGTVGEETMLAECMPCDDVAGQGGPRSQHVGGVFVGFVDGSVHYIDDVIDKGAEWDLDPDTYRTWQRLCASGDGQVVDASDFYSKVRKLLETLI